MSISAHPADWRGLRATATDISDWTGLHLMNVSRSVARLVSMGRVLREVDPADRRRGLLRLSRSGEVLFRRIAPSAQAREDIVRTVLSDKDVASLRRMLDSLIEHLRLESADGRVRDGLVGNHEGSRPRSHR